MDYFNDKIVRAEQKFAHSTGFTPKQMGAPVAHVFNNSVFFTENEPTWLLLKRKLEITENLRCLTSWAILFASVIISCSMIAVIFFSVESCLIIGGIFLFVHLLCYGLIRHSRMKKLKKLQQNLRDRFFEVEL